MAIELGDIVKDSISGYEGVVIGITNWLHGCRRLTIQAKGMHDGKIIEPISIDEPQCELIEAKNPPMPLAKTGGPHPGVVRQRTPTRR